MENPNYQYPQNPYNFAPMPPQQAPQRPVFLLVLCILTFVGCAWTIGSSAFGVVMYSFYMPSGFGGSATDYIIYFSAAAVLPALGKIAGAIFMLRLRKAGFYVYLVCEIAALAIDMISRMQTIAISRTGPLYDTWSSGNYGNTITIVTIATIAFMALMSVVFIVLYALQTKHMK